MSDPLSLVPLALAARGGRIDQFDAGQLVAAGLTLLQRCAPLVRAMRGRRAAILLPTGPGFLVALSSCDGRAAVLVNPLASPVEIQWQCRDADVGALFTNAALAARVPAEVAAAIPLVLLDGAPRHATVHVDGRVLDVDLGSHHGLALEGDVDIAGRDEPCAIVYTSALAGYPRGAVLSHRNLLANGRSTMVAAELTGDDHALAMLPFSHLFGLTVSAIAPLLSGARVTTMERFHPVRALELIERSGITVLVGVPALFAALVTVLERRGGSFTSHALRACICGGAVLPVSLQDRFAERTGVELRQGYGLTEASPVSLFNRLSRPNVRGTLGVSFPDVSVSIRDADSHALLPPGERGEICIRGDNVFRGYVHGATDALQTHDGWLYSGDEGCENPDGTISFLGVRKPMFTRNGFNIYPRELERVIGSLPGVARVRVHGIPDPLREHDIAVEVWGTVTEAEIAGWCESQLSVYKQPNRITVRSDAEPPG